MQFRKLAFALPAVLALVAGQTTLAHAQMTFTAAFDSTWSSDANAAADEATITNLLASYSSTFSNNVNVSIVFAVGGGLGESTTGIYTTSYSNYRTALTADKSTANGGDGNTAFLAELPAGTDPVLDVNGDPYANVGITSAQGRMLGFATAAVVTDANYASPDPANPVKFDSQVALKMSIIGTAAGEYSLTGVASHEIDEVLGLGSGLNGGGTPTQVSGEDFFRYSAPGVRSFSAAATSSYFSDDGGATNDSYFNQQAGADYQDWASDGGFGAGAPQVQDAFSTPYGTAAGPPATALGVNEYRALNDVGLNRIITGAAAPEPSSLLLLLPAALTLGGLVIRSRKAAVKGA